ARKGLRGIAVKVSSTGKSKRFISAIVLVAMASISCAQTSDKKTATLPAESGPELRWRYESGG
ncbi:MAG: hypothetical protein WAL47_08065, partial [Pyrinomonadaceae bacterium]